MGDLDIVVDGVTVWTGLSCFGVGLNGEYFEQGAEHSGFIKGGIFWLAEQLLASEGRLCFM
jgi:hypothetical protein